jgi:hypothetical protein
MITAALKGHGVISSRHHEPEASRRKLWSIVPLVFGERTRCAGLVLLSQRFTIIQANPVIAPAPMVQTLRAKSRSTGDRVAEFSTDGVGCGYQLGQIANADGDERGDCYVTDRRRNP